MVGGRQTACILIIFEMIILAYSVHIQGYNTNHSQPIIYHHHNPVPMEVCEQEFPTVQYLISHYKLW